MNRVDAAWGVGRPTIGPLPARRSAAELRLRARPEGGRRRSRVQPLLVARPARVRRLLTADDLLHGEDRGPPRPRARPADPRLRDVLRPARRVRSRSGAGDARDRSRRSRARALRRRNPPEDGRPRPGAARRGDGRAPGGCPGCARGDPWEPGLEGRQLPPGLDRLGEADDLRGLPRAGKGYREASLLVQEEIHRLWRWLAELHEADKRPAVATPP